jgi:hypothetical protein
LSLLIISAASIRGQNTPDKAKTAVPTVEEIFNNYEDAIGGRAAWASLVSLKESGTVAILHTGVTGTYENYFLGPTTKFYGIIKMANGAIDTVGFDGEVGWATNPGTGLRKLAGGELITIKRAAHFPEVIHFREFFDHVELKGKTHVGLREAYAIEMTSADGVPATAYFDSHTWLRLELDYAFDTPGGSESVHANFEDYRDAEGLKIKIPYREIDKTAAYTMVLQTKELRFNEPIDESIFKAPSFRAHVQQ